MKKGKQNNMHKKAVFLFPFILFASAFITDKLFFIGDFPAYFSRTGSFVNFNHKKILINELEEYLKKKDRRKVMVIFGNSRTFSFDNHYIEQRHPSWIFFNFSVPGGTSDYYLYYLEQFRDRGIRPDFIYFTVSPQGFNDTPVIAMDEVMSFGLPFSFILRYSSRYTFSQISDYTGKAMFITAKIRPQINYIIERLANNSEKAVQYREFIRRSEEIIRKERGSVSYGSAGGAGKEKAELLQKDALNTWNNYLNPFTFSEGQYAFTEDLLRICTEEHIPHALLRARVAPDLRRLKNEKPAVIRNHTGNTESVNQIWLSRMRKLTEKYGTEIVDLNEDNALNCDEFYDASHMAAGCFPEFTDVLIRFAEQK